MQPHYARRARKRTGENVTRNATNRIVANVAEVCVTEKIDQEVKIQKAMLAEAAR